MSALEQDELFPNPIGEQLKAAREAKKLSLAEVANETRIPLRHLQHIEDGEWEALPAITYSIGFARSYANAVGLNGAEIGAQLREQLGVSARPVAQPDYDAPADPTRVPPRSLALIAGAIAVLLMIGYVVWRSGAVDDSAVNQSAIANPAIEAPLPADATTTAPLGAPATPAADATGPVVLTATSDVWLRDQRRRQRPAPLRGDLEGRRPLRNPRHRHQAGDPDRPARRPARHRRQHRDPAAWARPSARSPTSACCPPICSRASAPRRRRRRASRSCPRRCRRPRNNRRA